MRGLSTVAAFAIFVVVFAIFMATAIYYYQLLRQTTAQAVQEVRSAALPPDQLGALIYNGTCVFSAAGPGSPFAYYLEVAAPTGRALTSSQVYPSLVGAFKISCPPGPGLYKYIGVRQNGQLAYLYVYVGPSVAWVTANGT
ncbi:MAG: flagellin biosynthesis protein FlgK, partial [Thermoproteus sp.]